MPWWCFVCVWTQCTWFELIIGATVSLKRDDGAQRGALHGKPHREVWKGLGFVEIRRVCYCYSSCGVADTRRARREDKHCIDFIKIIPTPTKRAQTNCACLGSCYRASEQSINRSRASTPPDKSGLISSIIASRVFFRHSPANGVTKRKHSIRQASLSRLQCGSFVSVFFSALLGAYERRGWTQHQVFLHTK